MEIYNNNKQTINKLNLKQNQVNKNERIKLNYNQTKLKLKSNYNIKKRKNKLIKSSGKLGSDILGNLINKE